VVSQSDAVTLQNLSRTFPAAATQFDIAIFSASSFVAPTAQPAPGVPAWGSSASAAH
jgi:hypothetical protein